MIQRLLSLFWVFGLLLASCGKKQESTSATTQTITESVYASGYVKSRNQYQVFSKTSGTLQKIWVKKGDAVRVGQLLFSVSGDVSRLNADNARLAANFSDLSANQDKLRELELSIEVSKKKMDQDALNLQRQKKLWQDEIGTRFELEQRELAYANSKAAYESARLRYQELKKQLQFSAEQSRNSWSISQSLLKDIEIRSEVDGRIYSIQKEKGELVSPQAPLALLGDASAYTLLLQVDENDIIHVKPGQQVFITLDSYKGQVFEARVDAINPLMNERSRTFEVEATFVKQPETLYPNLTFEANIVLQIKEKALTIPRSYLVDEEFVWVGKSEKRKVKTGLKDYQKVEILEGLSSSDKIFMPQE